MSRVSTFACLVATISLTVACGGDKTSANASPSGSAGAGNSGDDGGGASTNPCNLHTQFEGDENCILPPAEAEGVQLHIGPSSFDDPDVINAKDDKGNYLWLMEPGDERTECYHLTSPNTETHNYFKQQYRMRTGSHHMILRASNAADAPEGWGLCDSSIINAFGGTQHAVEDLPPGGVVAPEDEGLYHAIPAHAPIDAQLHFYNTTDKVRLREAWVNLIYKPESESKTILGMLGGFTRMNVPPHSKATVGNVCTREQAFSTDPEARVVTLFGHAHTHNTRFAVWHDKVDGSSELVYDSYDGAEAPTYTYNTIAKNPAPDPENRISGGRSGMLLLKAGEQLRYSCDINNDTDFTFVGQNEVNTDEMCNLFGSIAGAGFPCFTIGGTPPPKPAADAGAGGDGG
ncbi:MAG TPA: hypothetical protein VHE30_09765 [Polyangiaceae bacterium]|nr:hypothetical protein [Polyangiaceae bacterium]